MSPDAAPPWNKHVLRGAFTAALGVATGYALLVTVRRIEQILLLVAVAVLLTFGLQRAVVRLTGWGLPRRVAVVLVLLATAAVLGGVLAAIVPTVVRQVRQISSHLSTYESDLLHGKGTLGRLVKDLHIQGVASSLTKKATSGTSAGGGHLAISGIVGVGEAVLSGVTGVILVVVLTCYLLFALPRLERAVYNAVPASRRDRVQQLGEEIVQRLGGYLLGQLLVALVAGTGTLVWLLIFGIPFPFALAVGVALLGLIPVVGSSVGGALVSLVALSKGVPIGLATVVFYVAYRLFEDYLLVPRVMRRTVDVSPLVTIVALLIGGSLLGIIGALLAVPTAAAVQLVVSEVALPRLDAS
jgi:predicted PurR-regulated permease PerM